MILIKSEKEIEAMRLGGKILAEILDKIGDSAKPSVSTLELDKIAGKEIAKAGGTAAFKGQTGGGSSPYPATICASLNDQVVHGIPSKKVFLKEGDLLKIDVGMRYRGMYVDAARTFAVGKISENARRLLDATKEVLDIGIAILKPGANLFDYAGAVQDFIEKKDFSVVRDLVGHGVGRSLHEDPQIFNYRSESLKRIILKPRMTLAVEPMVNEGKFGVYVGDDGWVFKTKDGKLSAHFEDTVVVTNSGAEILTRIK